MNEIKLDEIDKKVLKACPEQSGRPWAEIIAPLLGPDIKRRTLYERRERLEAAGLIQIDREARRGRTLCFIEEDGERILLGRKGDRPIRGGDAL